jgi:hypothetical protein
MNAILCLILAFATLDFIFLILLFFYVTYRGLTGYVDDFFLSLINNKSSYDFFVSFLSKKTFSLS